MKIILSVLLAMLSISESYAVDIEIPTDCMNCGYQTVDGVECFANNPECCPPCGSGGSGPTIKVCTHRDCRNANLWTSLTNAVQTMCDRSTGDCLYRCQAGFYGSDKNCTACPDDGTSAVGSTAQTDCYMPSGASFADTSGRGTYTANCYWK